MRINFKTMNKSGKSSTIITVGVVALVALLAVIGLKVFGFLPQTALGGTTVDNGIAPGTYLATGSTTLSIAGVDAFNQGTSVGSSSRISTNGAAFTSGVTTASPGNKLSILLINNSIAGYHNAYIPSHTVPAAATDVIPVTFNKNASVTITIFNTNNQVIDGVGTNQTVAAGGTYTMAVRMDGTADASTQDMNCIFESNNGTASDKVTFSVPGAQYIGTSKPNWYTLEGTNSEVWVYKMPPIADAASVSGTIQITSATGKNLDNGALKMSCYTYDFFLDSATGKVAYDVEDSLGALQSMASYTKTAYFS